MKPLPFPLHFGKNCDRATTPENAGCALCGQAVEPNAVWCADCARRVTPTGQRGPW